MSTMVQAIRMALHVGETRLGVTDIFGEDVGPPLGGVFTATQGLKTAWNTPLDERGVICVGTRVRPGDILVGKVSPKSKTAEGATLFDVEIELLPAKGVVLRAGYSANAEIAA